MIYSQKLVFRALEGVDALGRRLDQLGLTDQVNRHNLAAFLFAGQKRLEGEWDSLQVRICCRRARLEHLAGMLEHRCAAARKALLRRFSYTA